MSTLHSLTVTNDIAEYGISKFSGPNETTCMFAGFEGAMTGGQYDIDKHNQVRLDWGWGGATPDWRLLVENTGATALTAYAWCTTIDAEHPKRHVHDPDYGGGAPPDFSSTSSWEWIPATPDTHICAVYGFDALGDLDGGEPLPGYRSDSDGPTARVGLATPAPPLHPVPTFRQQGVGSGWNCFSKM